jgi:hypothetical protein
MSILAADWRATLTGNIRSSQLERVVRSDSAPWLPSLLFQLRSLELSGRNIPGIGDLRIAEPTADHVRRLLATIPAQHLPEPRLAPFSGGGLALILNTPDRELTFTAYPDQNDFVFMLTNENDESIDEGILTLNQTDRLSEVITAFLLPQAR